MPMRTTLQMIGQCQAILEPNERDRNDSQSTSSGRSDKPSDEDDGEESLDDI